MTFKQKHEILPISTLDVRGQFAQVKAWASKSYAFNPHFTLPAAAQPLRWHIWFDGREAISAFCAGPENARKWGPGPDVEIQDLTSGDGLVSSAFSILDGSIATPIRKPKGLGVIIHLGTLLSTSSVKDAFKSINKFLGCLAASTNTPAMVALNDISQTIGSSRWRPFPLPLGADQQVVLYRFASSDMEGASALDAFQAPISVEVRSADMEASYVAARLIDGIESEVNGDNISRIFVFYYKRHTSLFLCDSVGTPISMRFLPQSEGMIPTSLKQDFSGLLQSCPTSCSSVVTTIFECSEGAALVEEALGGKLPSTNMDIQVQMLPRQSVPELLDAMNCPVNGVDGLPAFPMEFIMEYPKFIQAASAVKTDGFRYMNIAAKENLLCESTDHRNSIPTANDAKMIVIGKFLKFIFILVALLAIIGSGFLVFKGMRSDAWGADPTELAKSEETLTGLHKEMTDYTNMEAALVRDVTAWQIMDLVLSMFPESKDFVLESLSAKIDRDSLKGTSDLKILASGLTNETGLASLRALQDPNELATVFGGVSSKHNIAAIAPVRGGLRSIVKEQENTSFIPGSNDISSRFPMRFTLNLEKSLKTGSKKATQNLSPHL